MCAAPIPKGSTNAERNRVAHKMEKNEMTGIESLNTPRMRRRNGREVSVAIIIARHPTAIINAWQLSTDVLAANPVYDVE